MAESTKMGKAKGLKKWSKNVRKENRPYYRPVNRTEQVQQQQAATTAVTRNMECTAANCLDEETEVERVAPSRPLSSRPVWALSRDIVNSDECGVAPLPVDNNSSAMLRAIPVEAASASAGRLQGEVQPQGFRVINRTFSGSRKFLVTPVDPEPPKDLLTVPLAPRVLLNSQRENFQSPPRSTSAACYLQNLGLLTPPNKDALYQHQPHIPQGLDYFQPLPDEVLLQVMSHLSKRTLARCMCVCKRWHQVACDESLWRRLDMASRKIHVSKLKQLMRRGTTHLRLAKAEIRGRALPSPGLHEALMVTQRSIGRLQFLDLSMATVKVDTLTSLLSHCTHLRKVSLEHVGVNDTVLHMLSENPSLDTLNLAMCDGVTFSGLMPIFAQCSRLSQLNLAWCGMDSMTVSYVCGAVPENIRQLNISGCRQAMDDDDVRRLTSRCRSLVHLDLSDCQNLTEATVTWVLKLSQLETLCLNRCYNVYPRYLRQLRQLPRLTSLNIMGMLGHTALEELRHVLPPRITLNKAYMSTVARPTTGQHRTSIWEERMRHEA